MGAISLRPWRSTQRPRRRKHERPDGHRRGLALRCTQTGRTLPCGAAGHSRTTRADVVRAEELPLEESAGPLQRRVKQR